MGPVTLFDKSFIQSLSIDESVWFNQFFLCNVCPMIFIETLADLEKEMKNNKSAEDVVGTMAYKFPNNGMPNVFHNQICLGNLLGNHVNMRGQILLGGGYMAKNGNKKGAVFEQSLEEQALKRWEDRDFRKVEQLYAKNWRNEINKLSLTEFKNLLNYFPLNYKEVNTLEEVKNLVDEFLGNRKYSKLHIDFIFRLASIESKYYQHIVSVFHKNGMLAISEHAPYAAFILAVDLVFMIGMARGFISDKRNSNYSDICYLKYLPFSMIFVSNDKLHRRLAPLFLDSNQSFVWGQDLKQDLTTINDYFMKLPDKIKERGISYFGSTPPPIKELLTNKIWGKFLNYKIPHNDVIKFYEPKQNNKLVKELKCIEKIKQDENPIDNPQFIQVEHKIHKIKGSWYILPKGFKE